MYHKSKKTEVAAFLKETKDLIRKGQYDFVPRRKNLQALARQGLTLQDAKNEIMNLRTDDYHKGPKADFERPEEIWEFKREIENTRYYIKIKIAEESGTKVLKCLSFHEDEF